MAAAMAANIWRQQRRQRKSMRKARAQQQHGSMAWHVAYRRKKESWRRM
jgi:hypothetical protein